MKNKLFFLLVVFCFLGLLVQPSCKTAEDTQYVLTVNVGEGVTGVPATGSYSYTDADLVSYNYAAQTGYENLTVMLDGVTVGNSGVVSMNMSHSLIVTADMAFDVRGEWSGELTYAGSPYSINFNFSGGFYSGIVTGTLETIGYGQGTYSITNDMIEFRVVYEFGSAYWHEYTGTINNNNNMTGNWISQLSEDGPWVLDRD